MEFLPTQNKVVAGDRVKGQIIARGKHVVVIGGGDTGSDCVGTSNRQGAASVTQIELLPPPPLSENRPLTWPYWPLKMRTSSSHEEGVQRDWAIVTKSFVAGGGRDRDRVRALEAVRVEWKKDAATGQSKLVEIDGSAFEIQADLVLLAMGFTGPVTKGLVDGLGVAKDARGNVAAPTDGERSYRTSDEKVFAAGDMRRGQSLVVWAIREGRQCARAVDEVPDGRVDAAALTGRDRTATAPRSSVDRTGRTDRRRASSSAPTRRDPRVRCGTRVPVRPAMSLPVIESSVVDAEAVARRVEARMDAGSIDDAIAIAEDALDGAVGDARPVLQRALAVALTAAGQWVDAIRAAAAARDGFRRAGRRDGELDALIATAGVLRASGDCTTAIETLERAESLARELDDAARIGIVLRQIGVCCSLIGRHQQALSHLLEAEAIHASAGEPREHLLTRLSLYNAYNRHALTLEAGAPARQDSLVRHFEQWLGLAHDAAERGATRIELMALGNHAITLHDAGRHREAFDALVALLPRYRDAAMAPNVAICHFEIGRALRSLRSHEAAREHFREAVARFDRIGASGELRDALEGLADVEEAMGDAAAALKALRRVRTVESALKEADANRRAAQRDVRIELARLSSQWQYLAAVDPLTGLANRRGLEQWFAETQPRVDGGAVRVVLLHDLDHFKSINDRFGHPVGDEVLRRIARLMAAHCRPDDLAVRYGGEEFLLSMLSVDPRSAVDVGHRLRASIEAHDWHAVAPGLAVTVSIGVATSVEAADAAALLTLADRRLYAAKHAGRNRVVHDG